jgi:hypothetical protein
MHKITMHEWPGDDEKLLNNEIDINLGNHKTFIYYLTQKFIFPTMQRF